MDDLLKEFLTETTENIGTLDVELVHLEQNPNHPGLIDNIFRLVHTIKGTCGFLGLPRLEAVAHSAENVLGKFRDKKLQITPGAVSLILESLDCIKNLLAILESTEAEPAGSDQDLIQRLDALAESGNAAQAATGAAAPVPAPASEPAPKPAPVAAAPTDSAASGPSHSGMVEPGHVDPGLGRALKPGEVSLEELEAVFAATPASGEAPAPVAAVAAPAVAVAKAPPSPAPQPKPAAKAAEAKAAPAVAAPSGDNAVANQSIRVSVNLLESLMTTVSELVLTRNQLLQMVRNLDNSEFAVPLQRLSHVTTELQEGVMKTRMQPIGNAWAKLPRIIRDLSVELNKKIDLQMIGAETELDRQVLEQIKDPLTHMVRNSADHGLETPEDRLKAGKPEIGKVVLRAYHEGGHIIIEIKDDGRGLPMAKIKEKMIANGLATEAEIEMMPDQQIQQYIFKAGFSTAQKVTSVSGRGVGMDVVRTNIEKIAGTVALSSTEGKGSTFTIKIPLTLAIVSALIVECAQEKFAIPQLSVVELVRVSPGSDLTIELIKETPVLRLRNRLLPLIYLNQTLKLVEGAPVEAAENYIVVTQVGQMRFGIIVDRVFDTEEIVVKPVTPILRNLTIFSGNTILGDGSVIMILDPNGIAAASGEGALSAANADVDQAAKAPSGEEIAMLIFRAGGKEPKAVPLGLVQRLEEIAVDQIERVNGQDVVQYRGHLMPLIKVNDGLSFKAEGRQPILVFVEKNHSMGLVVDEIVDILEAEMNVEMEGTLPGVIGSSIIAGKATEIVDIAYYLEKAFGNWFKNSDAATFSAGSPPKKLLLIDDSSFFRNMLMPLLSAAGYQVTTADGAGTALRMRESGADFDIIVSDIEMPGMNGFEFVQEVKRGERWRDTPILALSAHTSPSDVERGRAAGFADYVGKCDRETLLTRLSESIASSRGAA